VQPAQTGRYYYTASLEISTLSDSDLDELQRFLEGDLDEVAQGKEGVGDALGRGATRFLLRLAGLPSLRLEVRSQTFDVR
jgi:Transcriptional regulator of heat shock gene